MDMNEKFVQYFNEALAMENAAEERVQSRIGETPIAETRQQLQYHLEQTRQQKDRLKSIITSMGGSPTGANLPAVARANSRRSSFVRSTTPSGVAVAGPAGPI